MICSLNEIGGMLRKAAMGSGYPVGLADALALAGVWLCAHDLDGVGATLDALQGGFAKDLDLRQDDGTLTVAKARVGRCGVSALELLSSGEIRRTVLEAPDSIMLLVGLAGAAAGDQKAYAFNTGGRETTIVDGGGLTGGRIDPAANKIEVELAEPQSDARPPSPHGVAVDEKQWDSIGELAARIYVPATDESRLSGAGAGLTDND